MAHRDLHTRVRPCFVVFIRIQRILSHRIRRHPAERGGVRGANRLRAQHSHYIGTFPPVLDGNEPRVRDVAVVAGYVDLFRGIPAP